MKGAQKSCLRLYGSICCWSIGPINFKVCYNWVNIKGIHFNHINKTCLTWIFWWIRNSQCFYCIDDWTANTNAGDKSFRRINKSKQFHGKLSFQFGVQALFKRQNTPGTFYFNYQKNIGCCFRLTCFIYYPSDI